MKALISPFLFLTLFALIMSNCVSSPSPTSAPEASSAQATSLAPSEKETRAKALELTSAAFAPGESIPGKYTCDGSDISPPLQWNDPPQDTRSFALIVDDPDAPVGTWVHWVLFNLPAETRALAEAVPPDAELPDGSRHGQNGWGRLGYGGPCPPGGSHRYFFRLYALDTMLDLNAGASKVQLLQALEGHILAQAELMGVYTRQ